MGIRAVMLGVCLAAAGLTTAAALWLVEPPRTERCLAAIAAAPDSPLAVCVCARRTSACLRQLSRRAEAQARIADAEAREQTAITLSKLLDVL